MKTEKDIALILSGTRALLGHITPLLRNVSITVENNKIIFKCIFDEMATDDDLELVSVAAAEIIADFPDHELEELLLKIPMPIPSDPLKNILYQRHEKEC